MASSASASTRASSTVASSSNFGQVIEYIQDRIYLASYTHPPSENTPFPYPSRNSRSPSKRSSKAHRGPTPATANGLKHPPAYFSIDRSLLYNAFHADFGPLHIGHLYRFAVTLHDLLSDPNNEGRAVVFWSHADARSRANAACILACYMVIIQNWPPHLALAPITQMDPPCMPFRDAGYSQADYMLNIQDVVYGVWKAKEEGLCSLKEFSLEEYEQFERVDMGDFNWVTPDFVAFASPQQEPTTIIPPSSAEYAALPSSIAAVQKADIPRPFKNVLSHFSARNVGLVVRLNSELYSSSYFTAMGMQHIDMIFDDGTCPPLAVVRKFIHLAHDMINVKHKAIAVHCKAGLGRTGCLIGAYLIYKYSFTANEVIAFMRFMRPGMVVGPQQHWLHLNQQTFREWNFDDTMKAKMSSMMPSTPPRNLKQRLASTGQGQTPPNGGHKRSALGEIASNDQKGSKSPDRRSSAMHDENLPAPTPGQPRKTSKAYGSSMGMGRYRGVENDPMDRPDREIVSATTSRRTVGEDESEEEFQVRMLSRRASRSPGSAGRDKQRRAVSCTTTTTTTTTYDLENQHDMENGGRPLSASQQQRLKTPGREKNGSGASALSVSKNRVWRASEGKGVRKTSGRVGSLGSSTGPR